MTTLSTFRVPVVALNTRVSPFTGLLFASSTIIFTVLVLAPSAVKLAGVAEMLILAGGPGIKLTWVVLLIPDEVAVTVAVPTVFGAVKIVLAMPLPSVIIAKFVTFPAVVEKYTATF